MDKQDKALLREIATTTQKLDFAVNGTNGSDGIVKRLTKIEEFIEKYTPTLMVTKTLNNLGWKIIRVMLIGAVPATLWFVFKLYIKTGGTP